EREPRRTARYQLQGSQAGGDGVRTEAGGGAAGAACGADGRATEGGGVPPGGRPAGTLGAAGAEAAAEARQAPDAAASHGPVGAQPGKVVLAEGAGGGVGDLSLGQPGLPCPKSGGMGGPVPCGQIPRRRRPAGENGPPRAAPTRQGQAVVNRGLLA